MGRILALWILSSALACAQGIASCNCIRSWMPEDRGNTTCYWAVMAPTPVAEATCRCYLRCTNGRYLNPSYRIWWAITGGGREREALARSMAAKEDIPVACTAGLFCIAPA